MKKVRFDLYYRICASEVVFKYFTKKKIHIYYLLTSFLCMVYLFKVPLTSDMFVAGFLSVQTFKVRSRHRNRPEQESVYIFTLVGFELGVKFNTTEPLLQKYKLPISVLQPRDGRGLVSFFCVSSRQFP